MTARVGSSANAIYNNILMLSITARPVLARVESLANAAQAAASPGSAAPRASACRPRGAAQPGRPTTPHATDLRSMHHGRSANQARQLRWMEGAFGRFSSSERNQVTAARKRKPALASGRQRGSGRGREEGTGEEGRADHGQSTTRTTQIVRRHERHQPTVDREGGRRKGGTEGETEGWKDGGADDTRPEKVISVVAHHDTTPSTDGP